MSSRVASDNHGGGSTSTVPSELLFRTGLTDAIEFRLGFDGYQINAGGPDGVGHTSVGFKVHLQDEGRYTPEISVLPSVSLSTGNKAVAVDQPEPELHLIWSKSLTDNLTLGGNINFAERLDEYGSSQDRDRSLCCRQLFCHRFLIRRDDANIDH
jgi:hypothetical protein